MNSIHDLFLLMFTLSQMRDKNKIMELFQESISEMFKPVQFIFSEQEDINSAFVEEISTRNFSYGYISSTIVPNQESKSLLQNAIQMLAVILDRLKFENELKNRADLLETIAQKQIIEITSYVDELETARLASLNLIEDLKEEIHERKQTEEALKESEQRFLTFMNNTSVFAWMKDEDLKYVFLNKAFEDQHGITLKDVQGKDDFAFRNKHIAEILQTNDRKVLSSGEILITEEIVEDRFGQLKHAIVYKFLVKGLSGKQYLGGMSIDISERKQAEEEIKKLNEELEQKVLERTNDLETKVLELNRLNKLFVDRELRMIELKQKIKALEE